MATYSPVSAAVGVQSRFSGEGSAMHPLRSEIRLVARTAQQAPRFLRVVHQTLVDVRAGHWAALTRV
eukprot:COSAG01_NODE_302_length_19206_cov_11.098687_11_plen_67_part_00